MPGRLQAELGGRLGGDEVEEAVPKIAIRPTSRKQGQHWNDEMNEWKDSIN